MTSFIPDEKASDDSSTVNDFLIIGDASLLHEVNNSRGEHFRVNAEIFVVVKLGQYCVLQ